MKTLYGYNTPLNLNQFSVFQPLTDKHTAIYKSMYGHDIMISKYCLKISIESNYHHFLPSLSMTIKSAAETSRREMIHRMFTLKVKLQQTNFL